MRKKILLFVSSDKGTIAQVSHNLYKALSANNSVDLKVVLLVHFNDSVNDFGDVEYIESENDRHFSILRYIQRILRFRRIKKQLKPDITINTLFICSILSVLSGGNEKKIGIFHSPHSQASVNGKLNLFLSYLSYKFIYNGLTKLYCVSSEVRDSILKSFKGIDPAKVEVVYNIHDVDSIRVLANEKIKEEHQIYYDKNVILYCGRLDKNKAPDRVLKAFVGIQNQISEDMQLLFIGKDEENLWPSLKEIAKIAKLEDRVHYLGIISNPYPYIEKAKLMVSCSYSEGLPGVIIESFLLKTPVVTTNSSKGIWEIMSCIERYDEQLNENQLLPNGVITPNLSFKDKLKCNFDIEKISEAIIYVLNNQISISEFEFEDKIKSEFIIKKFIS
jgi:glycosyltransferase involved in cell wall biosynthesis